MSTPVSTTGSPVSSPRGQTGPFPRPGGRRGLVEKSPLIRHPSTLSAGALPVYTGMEDGTDIHHNNVISTENHQFLKDVSNILNLRSWDFFVLWWNILQIVDQVLTGDGVGWLKLSRLKKLMQDENYRVIILNKLVSSLEHKVAPDDHIQDVVRVMLPISCRHFKDTNFSVSPNLCTKEFWKCCLPSWRD